MKKKGLYLEQKRNNMTREELIYLGVVQIFAAYESNPPKVEGRFYQQED